MESGKIEREAPAFSPFQSSTARLLFLNFFYFLLEYPVGASAEEKLWAVTASLHFTYVKNSP